MPESVIRLAIAIDNSQAKASVDQLSAQIANALGPNLQARITAAETRVMERLGGSGALGLITRGATAAAGALGKVGQAITSIGAGIYVFERVARTLESIGSSMAGTVRTMIEAADTYRKFEISVGSSRGLAGLAGGRPFDDALIQRAGQSGVSISTAQATAREMLLGTGTAAGIGLAPSNASAARAVTDFAQMVQRLAVLLPEQNEEEIARSLRLALDSADPRSLRRLGFTQGELADAAGVPAGQLKGNPTLTRQALQAIVDSLVPANVAGELQNLVSARVARLRDTLTRVERDLVDPAQGIAAYDKLAGILDHVETSVNDFLASPAWGSASAAASENIGTILQNVSHAGLSFLKGVTGVKADENTPEGVAEIFVALTGKLKDFSSAAPTFAEGIGSSLRLIGLQLDSFTDHLADVAKRIAEADPTKRITLFHDDQREAIEKSGAEGADDASFLAHRNELAARAMQAIGVTGAKLIPGEDHPAISAPPWWGRLLFDFPTERPGWRDNSLDISGASDPELAKRIISAVSGMSSFDAASDQRVVRALKLGGIEPVQPPVPAGPAPSAFSQIAQHYDELFRLADARKDYGSTAQLAGVRNTIGEMSGAVGEDKFSLGEQNLRNALGKLGGPDGLFAQAAGVVNSRMRDFDQAIDKLVSLGEGDLDDHTRQEAQAAIDDLTRGRDEMQSVWGKAIDKLRTSVVGAYGRAEAQLIAELSKDSPAARSSMIDQLISGRGPEAAAAAKATGLDPSRFGFNAVPVEEQREVLSAFLSAHQAAIADAGHVNNLPDRDIQLAQLKFLRSDGMPLALQARGNAIASGDERAILNASAAVADLSAKMRDLQAATNDALQGFIRFGDQVQSALESSVGDTLTALIEGTGKLSDIWRSFANQVVNDFTHNFAHFAMTSLLGPGNDGGRSGIGGLLSGAVGGGGNAGGLLGKLFSSGGGYAAADSAAAGASAVGGSADVMPSIGTMGISAAANGAIWPGFTPFADGGVVSKPVLGLIGEAHTPEAVIPMPNGRSVPVEMSGSHGGPRDIYVVSDHGEAFRRGFHENRDMLIDTIANDVRGGGKLHRAIRSKSS